MTCHCTVHGTRPLKMIYNDTWQGNWSPHTKVCSLSRSSFYFIHILLSTYLFIIERLSTTHCKFSWPIYFLPLTPGQELHFLSPFSHLFKKFLCNINDSIMINGQWCTWEQWHQHCKHGNKITFTWGLAIYKNYLSKKKQFWQEQ